MPLIPIFTVVHETVYTRLSFSFCMRMRLGVTKSTGRGRSSFGHKVSVQVSQHKKVPRNSTEGQTMGHNMMYSFLSQCIYYLAKKYPRQGTNLVGEYVPTMERNTTLGRM